MIRDSGTIEKYLRRINTRLVWYRDEPLAPRTTFRLGGRADYLVEPSNAEEVEALVELCSREELPLFVLGSGANILVSDKGIRGLTLATRRLRNLEISNGEATLGAGWEVDEIASLLQEKGYRCLDFAAGMPSSVGGAVWMNARCYDQEVSEIFQEAKILGPNGITSHPRRAEEWAYKVSPFQGQRQIILEARFQLREDDPQRIKTDMDRLRADRESKGHYRSPCAGSIFKNNRAFGQPSGVIIDRLGLKGLSVGGARVSDWHANIIVNTGTATARDVRDLIALVKNKVLENTGFLLEEEVLYVGDWD